MTAAAELSAIVHSDILNAPSGMPAKAISAALGKNYFTLLKEANPAHPSHKFDLNLLVPTMLLTGSNRPAEHIAKQVNAVMVPIPKENGTIAAPTRHCSQVLFGVAVFLQIATAAYEDSTITREEYAECHSKAHRAVGEILAFLERIRNDAEAGQ